MNIAIASETEEIDGLVPATFKESPFLMIIDADKNQIFHVYGKQDPDNLVFAKKVVEHDCEAVICGPIEKEPYARFPDNGSRPPLPVSQTVLSR